MKRLIIPALALCAAAFAPSFANAAYYKWTATIEKVQENCCTVPTVLETLETCTGIVAYDEGVYFVVNYGYGDGSFQHFTVASESELAVFTADEDIYYSASAYADGSASLYATVYREGGKNYLCRMTVEWEYQTSGNSIGPSSKPVAPGGREIQPGASGPVPEPTSGLLLIVGAGLLALRRRERIGGAE